LPGSFATQSLQKLLPGFCDRWGKADLDWLIQIGHGDKSVTEARFRCRDCGEIVEKLVRPPVPSLGEAVAYI